MSSFDAAWSEAFLVPPPSKVPMWRQVQESEDCCDFTLTKKSQCSSRVASYGSFYLNEDKKKRQGVASHRLRASLRSTDRERQPQRRCQPVQDAARKGKEDENKGCPPAAWLAAPTGRGGGPKDPPQRPAAFFARDFCTFHHPVPCDYEQRQLPLSVAVGVVAARILARLGRASDHGTSRT